MQNTYLLDTEDEAIINELDDMYGVVQNKEVLKDIILYIKLKKDNKLDLENCNIIVRNDSTYNQLEDLLKVCSKIFIKYNIIENSKICYLDRIVYSRKECPFDKIGGIEDSIIVINDRKLRIDYEDEIDILKRIVKQNKNKIFIFHDTSYCEGETDERLSDLASFRMKLSDISEDDKIVYCKKRFDEEKLKYKQQELREYTDVEFWKLKKMVTKLIIECKSKNINFIDKQMLNKNKEFFSDNSFRRERGRRNTYKQERENNEDINELIGLKEIKKQMEKILNYVRINKERGQMPTLHMCFTGNPGTGKTTMARIIGKIFEEEKILSGSGEFAEVHGRDLVGKYVGWTAQKVHSLVERSIGNVLFIDEAYSLVADKRGLFEDEAIATLIKEMEDHRNEICVILAGYTEEMNNLIRQNPGFESRIQFTINFPDYSEEELLEIFNGLCKKEKYKLSNNCKELLIENFAKAKQEENFGNGRYVRNIFEKTKIEQADRIARTGSKAINSINKTDIEKALQTVVLKKQEVRRIGF